VELGVWDGVQPSPPPPLHPQLMRGTVWATVVAATSLAAVAVAAEQPARGPAPLRGVPLATGTGLRLVVADIPPFVLDVDASSATPVRGVPAVHRGTLSVLGVAGRAAVVVARSAADARIYAVRGREARVSYLGTGTAVVPAGNGEAVWVKSRTDRSHCALRRVGLDGRVTRAPRGFRCATTIYPGASLGLVVNRTRVLDPVMRRTVRTTRWGILAAAGEKLVLAAPGTQLTLIDAATGTQRRLQSPSPLGIDGPAVDPGGRLVALAFANASTQLLDVWLLDTATAKLTHVPGLPAVVSLKRTSMAWTVDGRLVLLAESGGKDLVAVWRPGRRRLAVKAVRLPDRSDSGSDSFALLG
jgi:hypothetical protein